MSLQKLNPPAVEFRRYSEKYYLPKINDVFGRVPLVRYLGMALPLS